METAFKENKEYLSAKEIVMANQAFDINNFPFLKNKKEQFFKDNPDILRNKILNNFLADQYNLSVFVLAIFGEKEINDILSELFKKFYFQYRFISYISKLLYFEAIKFDRNLRKQTENELLDMPLDEENDMRLSDTIFKVESEFEIASDNFADSLTDERIYAEYKKLTKKQQQILHLAYYTLFKDSEIAKKLNTTQQAVSKSRKKALNRLKNDCNYYLSAV